MEKSDLLISPADDLILRDMLPEPLIAFSQANSITNRVVTDFQKRAYNIAAFLSPFFTEVQYYSFRGLQAVTGLLISGSTALQFLDRTYYKGSDLDLYVNHVFARRVHQWLVGNGYIFQSPSPDRSFLDLQTALAELNAPMPTPLPKQYGGRGIVCVLKYRNPSNMKVDVILTRFTPLQAILSFHSTCVMNVISYAHAISLYPRATFVDRVACHIESGRTRDVNAISKYNARGWTMIDRTQALSRPEFRVVRRVGDRHTWVIPLRTRKKSPRDPRLDMVFANSWKLGIHPPCDYLFDFHLVFRARRQEAYCFGSYEECPLLRKYLIGTTSNVWSDHYFLSVMKLAVKGGHWEKAIRADAYDIK